MCLYSPKRLDWDRAAIFGLRGPNAELPIAGGELARARAIGINKFNVKDRKTQYLTRNYNILWLKQVTV